MSEQTKGPADPPGKAWRGKVVSRGVVLHGAVVQEGFEVHRALVALFDGWTDADATETERVFVAWAQHERAVAAAERALRKAREAVTAVDAQEYDQQATTAAYDTLHKATVALGALGVEP